jgi:NAD(P)-dependent dehydrogenase (short-subunit alcohol dehydrogenase family)
MRTARRGTIVTVSSIGARLSNPLVGFYHASKYALSALSEALSVEMAPFGVRVVGVAPGIIGDTEGFSRLGGSSAQGQESGSLTQAVPLGRLGCSDDVAAAVVFLCRQVTRHVLR